MGTPGSLGYILAQTALGNNGTNAGQSEAARSRRVSGGTVLYVSAWGDSDIVHLPKLKECTAPQMSPDINEGFNGLIPT